MRCINSGAMPFPKHGRQMKINEAAITDDQVLTRILTLHASMSQQLQRLHESVMACPGNIQLAHRHLMKCNAEAVSATGVWRACLCGRHAHVLDTLV